MNKTSCVLMHENIGMKSDKDCDPHTYNEKDFKIVSTFKFCLMYYNFQFRFKNRQHYLEASFFLNSFSISKQFRAEVQRLIAYLYDHCNLLARTVTYFSHHLGCKCSFYRIVVMGLYTIIVFSSQSFCLKFVVTMLF